MFQGGQLPFFLKHFFFTNDVKFLKSLNFV